MTQESIEISMTDEEIRQIAKDAEKADFLEKTKIVSLVVSYFARAVQGQPPEAQDIITRLTNVKNILERSRFPTYPLLAKQVYLRLIALYNPQAYACKDWADLEAEALISYKGLSREENVEMTKAATRGPQQEFIFGATKPAPMPEVAKKHFWSRTKKEESEFVHQ